MGSKGYQFKNAQPPSRIILLSISSHPINTVGLIGLYSVIATLLDGLVQIGDIHCLALRIVMN